MFPFLINRVVVFIITSNKLIFWRNICSLLWKIWIMLVKIRLKKLDSVSAAKDILKHLSVISKSSKASSLFV